MYNYRIHKKNVQTNSLKTCLKTLLSVIKSHEFFSFLVRQSHIFKYRRLIKCGRMFTSHWKLSSCQFYNPPNSHLTFLTGPNMPVKKLRLTFWIVSFVTENTRQTQGFFTQGRKRMIIYFFKKMVIIENKITEVINTIGKNKENCKD